MAAAGGGAPLANDAVTGMAAGAANGFAWGTSSPWCFFFFFLRRRGIALLIASLVARAALASTSRTRLRFFFFLGVPSGAFAWNTIPQCLHFIDWPIQFAGIRKEFWQPGQVACTTSLAGRDMFWPPGTLACEGMAHSGRGRPSEP